MKDFLCNNFFYWEKLTQQTVKSLTF